MGAAVQCVRDIFPESAIKTFRSENSKKRIIITTDAFGKTQEVWSGKQANLFMRFPKRRRKATDNIKLSLADLKEKLL
jgi:hypothetical protein